MQTTSNNQILKAEDLWPLIERHVQHEIADLCIVSCILNLDATFEQRSKLTLSYKEVLSDKQDDDDKVKEILLTDKVVQAIYEDIEELTELPSSTRWFTLYLEEGCVPALHLSVVPLQKKRKEKDGE